MADSFSIDADEEAEEEGIVQLVGFNIADEKFGVDILMVQEIIRAAEITAVPNSPEFVEGVINLRGNIIPVVDLRKRLHLFREAETQTKSWVLILSIGDRVVGFVVDRVTEVIKIPEESIEPAPDIVVTGLESQYIQGVCDIDKQLLVILDFDLVLYNEEQQLLQDIEDDEILLDEDSIISSNDVTV